MNQNAAKQAEQVHEDDNPSPALPGQQYDYGLPNMQQPMM